MLGNVLEIAGWFAPERFYDIPEERAKTERVVPETLRLEWRALLPK
jgi:hypothetical protein